MKLNFKRLVAGAITGCFMLAALAGCSDGSGSGSNGGGDASSGEGGASSSIKIGYVNLADTDVFCMSRRDAFVAAANEKGWQVDTTDGDNDVQKQIDQAKSFIARGVDILVIVPCDSAGIVPAVQEANNAGIPVILFGIDASDSSLDYTFIGSPNYEAGVIQGNYFADALPEGANILYLAGTAGLDHSFDRREGMKAALAENGRDDITILDDQDGDYVKDEGMRITQAWVQRFGADGFDGIIAANDQMALGAMEALKGANLLTEAGEILISGVDGTTEAVAAVQEGTMAQTVLQDAAGQAAAASAAIETILAGGDAGAEILVPFVSITSENVADYAS